MRKSGAYGPALATLGAAGLVVSLWRTWYNGHVAQSAWQTFTTTPAVLLAIALLGGGLSALELTQRVGDTSRLAMLAGAVAVALVGYRIVIPPGPRLVHVASGAYVALASALALLSGGLLAAIG